MIVFEKGKPKPSDYRKFRIKTVSGPDDYACMREVLTRRFRHGIEESKELEEKAHNFELEPSKHTVLCIDYAQNGIGSNSCGPEVAQQYRFDEEQFCFTFRLVPFVRGTTIRGKE